MEPGEISKNMVYQVEFQGEMSSATMLGKLSTTGFLKELIYPFWTWISAMVLDNCPEPMYTSWDRAEHYACTVSSIGLSEIPVSLSNNAARKERPYPECNSLCL